ncbi:MAG: hypothetical protein HOV81_07310, partial [Kofleriaceae bacterium]|nr:hypothetical protein [Kofleriaceae bacterium]
MRHPLGPIVLAACVLLIGSVAEAQVWSARHHKVSKKAKHRIKIARPAAEVDVDAIEIFDEDAEDSADDEPPAKPRKLAKKARPRKEAESDRVAFADDEVIDSRELVDDDRVEPVKVRKRAAARGKDWHVAIGPYLWASSVDANVSIGSANVAAGVDFFQMEKHAKYGAELLADARFGRVTLSGDLMYGVVAINGTKDVGPLMVTLAGTASSLLVDSFVGYRLAGDEESLLSFETRAGARYQRTAVSGSVSVEGGDVSPPESVDAGGDALAGARVFVRPSNRFSVSLTGDIGVYGVSKSTWSAAADASVRVTSRLLLSLGWR